LAKKPEDHLPKRPPKKTGKRGIKPLDEKEDFDTPVKKEPHQPELLKVVVENMDAYYDFHVNKLGQAENIGQLQSTFVMGVIKQTHQLII